MTREVVWHHGLVTPTVRRESLGWSGATIWLTGLSGSGKSTIATHVEQMLVASSRPAYILDGDNLRTGLNADLGFSDDDRRENIRRVGEVARLMADSGVVVLVPVISPFRDARDAVRAMHEAAQLTFFEVFVDTPWRNANDETRRACISVLDAAISPTSQASTAPMRRLWLLIS